MQKIFTTIILGALIHGTAQAQLSGLKTIGGTAPDYETLAAAAADLNAQGVGNGGVIFNLRGGIYDGEVSITTSNTNENPIVFRSESLNANDVTIQSENNGGPVVQINGSSNIRFEHLKIEYNFNGNTILGRQAFNIAATSENVVLENCILKCPSSSVFSGVRAVVSQTGSSTKNFHILNCHIIGGSNGINVEMAESDPSNGFRIENNIFDQTGKGSAIEINNVTAPQIHKNTIKVNHSGVGSTAIFLRDCQGKTQITGNYIYQTLSTYLLREGISLVNCSSTPGDNALIANNSIQMFNAALFAYGIIQYETSKYWDIINNTIYISGGQGEPNNITRPYVCRTENDETRVMNNVFANFSTNISPNVNVCVDIFHASGVSVLSNNCYWKGHLDPFRGKFNGVTYEFFEPFIAATQETGSLNINPQMSFVPNVGWKASNELLAGAGQFVQEVTDDIDGVVRTNPTSIGAHEFDFNIECINASITSQPNALTLCIDSVSSLNVGATGTELTYQWQVLNTTTQNWDNVTGEFFTGENTSTLQIIGDNSINNSSFRVKVQAECGEEVISTSAILSVINCETNIFTIHQHTEIKLFPNPATELVNITWTGNAESLELSDLSGKILQKIHVGNNFQNSQIQLDLTKIENGIYMISFDGKGLRKSKSLVVKK